MRSCRSVLLRLLRRLLRLYPLQRGADGGLRTAVRRLALCLPGALSPSRLLHGAFPFETLLVEFEAFARVFAAAMVFAFLADHRLAGAIILNERYMAGADVGAGAAFDAVEQVVRL